MPNLKINRCEDCPHSRIIREEWMDDCYKIVCEHGEQTNTEGFTTKINRGGGIHFNCPLDKPEVIQCSNSDCDWEGTKDEMKYIDDWGVREYWVCPECREWLL